VASICAAPGTASRSICTRTAIAAADAGHARHQLDDFTQLDRLPEIDAIRTRGHHRTPGEAAGHQERGLVHPCQRLAAEQGAEVVAVVRKHDLDEPLRSHRPPQNAWSNPTSPCTAT
jgi:hypothetical protein